MDLKFKAILISSIIGVTFILVFLAGLVFHNGITGKVIVDSSNTINIDFGGDDSVKSGEAAIGNTGDFWNSVKNNVSEGMDLKYANGQNSGISVLTKNLVYSSDWNSQINDPMYNSYIYNNGADGEITLVGLEGNYDLYLYGHGNEANQNSNFSVRVGNANYEYKTTSNSSYNRNVWEEGSQYVIFRNINVNLGQNISIKIRYSSSFYRVINGLQITNANTEPLSCIDSDGRNYFNRGIVNFAETSSPDECNGTKLVEKFCSNDLLMNESIDCVAGCQNGACIVENKSDNLECIDSDQGILSNQSGNVTLNNYQNGEIIFTSQNADFCIGDTLVEFSCSANNLINSSIACQQGCQNGACIGQEIKGTITGGQGCFVNGTYLPFGYRLGKDFCELNGEMKLQKRVRYYDQVLTCNNNFECESNLCTEGKCVPIATFIEDSKKSRSFLIKSVCKLTNPIDEEAYLDCLDEYLTTPYIADQSLDNNYCFLKASIQEKLNESSGKVYFELINAESVYGDFGNLLNNYDSRGNAYVAQSYDFNQTLLFRVALYSSRFMFTDDYSGVELTGDVIEFKDGTSSLFVPNSPQVRGIKVFDSSGEEISTLRISKEQSNCIRTCGVEFEPINIDNGEVCCPGFKPILNEGLFSQEWTCMK